MNSGDKHFLSQRKTLPSEFNLPDVAAFSKETGERHRYRLRIWSLALAGEMCQSNVLPLTETQKERLAKRRRREDEVYQANRFKMTGSGRQVQVVPCHVIRAVCTKARIFLNQINDTKKSDCASRDNCIPVQTILN